MKRTFFFLASAVLSVAQVIPNRYIVELAGEPTASVAAAKKQHFSPQDRDVQARRAQVENQHRTMEAAVRGMGGSVSHHFYSVLNGMAVTLTPDAAAKLAQTPGVRGISPVRKYHVLMDQALNLHRITQAWQTINGGSANSGAGIRIGILDTGIDAAHPAFQNFSPAPPNGFPIFTAPAVAGNVNNKVIVARVYSDIPDGIDNTTTDGNDYVQHGTTVAGIAAGLPTNPNFAGIGTVSGVAPGAWIGNYKVQDDNGAGTSVTFIAGLEDALNDGMNVVNYSAGGPVISASDETGQESRAIANAVAAGMLVVCAAGNSGPSLGSVGSPGVAAAAIAVGAIQNQRWFWFAVTPQGGSSIYAIPPDEELTLQTGDVSGPLVDVSTVASGDTHACSSLPASSLTGKIALIQRGSSDGTTCLFATKLNNAQAAGAIGAVVYDNTSRSFFDYTLSGVDVSGFELALSAPPQDTSGNDRVVSWSVGSATLPAVLVSRADGSNLLKLAQGGTTVDLDFDGKTAMPYPANVVTDFSSVGPTPGANLKPDIVAVGDWLVAPTATTAESTGCTAPYSLDLNVGCYPPYTFLDSPFLLDFLFQIGFGALWDDGAGTSFSTPIVTGTIAMVMAAKPGLTAAQYRSLVTNSSPEFDQFAGNAVAPPQLAGGGILDGLGALQQGLTASPSTLNFLTSASGGGSSSSAALKAQDQTGASSSRSQTLTLTNIGASDTFTVSFKSLDGVATPSPDSANFNLANGASKTITLTLPGSLAAGQYHGFVLVSGTKGQTQLRVPYWYGVAGNTAQNINVLFNPGFDPSACNDTIDFRLLDAVGLPVTPAADPTVTTNATRASVTKVSLLGSIPGTYEAQIVTGRPDSNGNNVFTVSADNSTWQIVIGIDNSGATPCNGSSSGSGGASIRSRALKHSRTPARSADSKQ